MKKAQRILCFLAMNFAMSATLLAQLPSFSSVQVNANGEVDLYYQTVPPAGSFDGYTISRWDATQSIFRQIAQIADANTNQYHDNQANGNSQSIRYKISSGGVESECQTLHLNAQRSTTHAQEIQLSWNSPGEAILADKQGEYNVYRRTTTETLWRKIGSTPDLHFTDLLPASCRDTAFYVIELWSQHLSRSTSNEIVVPFGDREAPAMPEVTGIQTDTTNGKITLVWRRPMAEDTYGYVVLVGNPAIPVDSVFRADQTTYTFQNESPVQQHSFSLLAFDTCRNTSLRTPIFHNIVLEVAHTPCKPTVQLKWNACLLSGDFQYVVYRKKPNEPFTAMQTIPQTAIECDVAIDPSAESYQFYVEAQSDSGHCFRSNVANITVKQSPNVRFAYIRSLQVADDNHSVELAGYVDSTINVRGYDIYRIANARLETAEKVAHLPFTGKGHFVYTDRLPTLATATPYSYFLSVTDACGIATKQSEVVDVLPLILQMQKGDDRVLLSWNDYNGWDRTEKYEIYSTLSLSKAWEKVAEVDGNTLRYEDQPIKDGQLYFDKIHYCVYACEGSTPPDGVFAKTKSSVKSFQNETVVFIPNAFSPSSNDPATAVFRPQCNFMQENSYLVQIFTRWGEKLFETTNVENGWDGSYKGMPCAAGTYIYYVECKLSNGRLFQKGGIVNLIE